MRKSLFSVVLLNDFILLEFCFTFFVSYSLLAKTHFGETHDKHVVIIPSNPRLYMTTDVP